MKLDYFSIQPVSGEKVVKPDDAVEIGTEVDETPSTTDATASQEDDNDDSYATPEDSDQIKEECKKHFNTVIDFC